MMTPGDYRRLDAVAIDELVGQGEVSALDISDAANVEYERAEPQINAVVEWYDDPTEPRSVAVGPALRGVPILRKDYGSAEAGRLVEMGSRLAAGVRAIETAPFIEALQGAGVQILGRSAVPEFIQHGTTESAVHGATRNPWDRSLSAGGSSGGAAAAVAAGVVPLAHASDCAGSIRIPAATCGLVGLKPGRNRVPWPAGDWDGIAVEFVVTRSVRDAARCLDVVGVGSYRPVPERLRIAVSTEHWAGYPIDRDVVSATEGIARLVEGFGHVVEPIVVPVDYPLMMQTWPASFSRFTADDVARVEALTGRRGDASNLEPMTIAAIETVRRLSRPELVTAAAARTGVVERLERELAAFDVLLTPTLARSTIPLDWVGGEVDPADYFARNDEIFPYSYLFNLAGWPSISLPARPDPAGHPIGAQVSAPIGSERILLTLAAAIEQAQPWPTAAPR